MREQWDELKETIIELRDNNGTVTQQECCQFLANLMNVLEAQMAPARKKGKRMPYIEKNELLSGIYSDNPKDVMLYIARFPTADVVERKRGKWIDAKPMSGRVGKVCSACGNEAYWDSDYGQQLFDWCPYCGADCRGNRDV